jgi:nucleoside-diphosphate-sugar epimerase
MTEAFRPGVSLITGASGFIGSHLRDALLAQGHDVVALTRPGSPEPKRGRAAAVDYDKPESLERVIAAERPEFVFHLAGATKGVTYADFKRANVMPTQNLLDAVRKHHPGLKRFVHVSSLSAYGPSGDDTPVREHDERKPIEFYGKSKLEAELVVEAAGDSVPWTIIRPPSVYGPNDVDFLELFRLAGRGLNVFYGNRDRPMSFVYVEDLVAGTLAAARSDATRSKGYFLCDGVALTWGQFQAHVVSAVGKRVLELNLPEFSLDLAGVFGEFATKLDKKPRLLNRQKAMLAKQAWMCTHAQARSDFGYAPSVTVEDGIPRTHAWYRDQKWL